MARRLYLGRLPPDARSEEVSKFFDGYGRIVDCRVMTGFGFVEFESSRDAEDAVQHFNGKPFMGANIVVEFAKESRPRHRDVYESERATRARRPPGFRLIVSGISRDTSWQDLKDFGREAGSVSFADIDRDNVGEGILEYLSRDDADRAVKELDGKDLRGQAVRVAVLAPTTSVGMIVEMTDVTTATAGMIAGTTVVATAVNAPDHLITVANTTIVGPPGLLRPGGMMIKGLLGMMTDGTMTDEGAIMMIEESLTLIMTVAGTTTAPEGMTEGATKRTTATTSALQGTLMEIVVGHAKLWHGTGWALGRIARWVLPQVRFGHPDFRHHALVLSSS
ncbi:hypothetical protein EIP91_010731 [Steccherinum ochraceum]|uniref:RRM domain-containing protein n=1 Tax=Steccherinum ochraceum TaxID=92696 RepID=A0A4R0RQG8_9APHY|nr:hypothetical protein EIP91_010731 [Steccherinum ochraceum]